VATLVVGEAGGVAPVQIYTSYDVAVAAAGQVSVAVVCVASVVPSTGAVLVTQAGTGIAAVVKLVLLETSQPVAGPLAFLGVIYQSYNTPEVRAVAS
jgi:hypothetical protein